MPRGGPRVNSGGHRPGAGRKNGSGTVRTQKTNEIAQKAAGEGAQPLQVMLEAMRSHRDAGNLDKAAAIAATAAPYVHPKKSAIAVEGMVGMCLEVVEEIIEVSVSHQLEGQDGYSNTSACDQAAQGPG